MASSGRPTNHNLVLPLFSPMAQGEPKKRYRTLVADPPWRYGKAGGYSWRKGAPSGESRPMTPYPTMLASEIAMIPVGTWAHADCHLYLWTTQRYLRDAFRVLESWGFEYKKTLIWCKAPTGFSMGGAFGNSTEFILLGTRGQLSFKGRMPRDWFDWKRGEHSQKPEAFYDIVEQMSHGPYLDVFARRLRMGWDCWGDETYNVVGLPAVGVET